MFRMWCKIFKENRLVKDTVIEDTRDTNRTRKVLDGLEECCNRFNLTPPIWLDLNVSDFKRFSYTRFNSHNFIENIDFDYLEIRMIDED